MNIASGNIIKRFFEEYGLGFVIAAGFFGAGSIYILSASGIRFGYALLWAVVLSGLIGVKTQSMSIILGIHRKPLMVLIREKIGKGLALGLAVYLSAIATLWVMELRAADGMALAHMIGGGISWQLWNYGVMGLAILFVLANVYSRLEKFVTGFLFITVLCFIIIACLKPPEPSTFFKGLIPRFEDAKLSAEYIVLVVCILGTTVLWPNLFLQSTIVKEKGWKDAAHFRFAVRDTVFGFSIGILGSAAILIASATIIKPLGVDKLKTFITPALILSQSVGHVGSILFLLGLFMAAFNSSIVITTTIVYILHQAAGKPVKFGDRSFLVAFTVISLIGSLFPEVSRLTGMTVVDAIILFPGVNGALGLPIVVLFMFGFKYALIKKDFSIKTGLSRLSNFADLLIVLLTLFIAVRSVGSLWKFVTGGV